MKSLLPLTSASSGAVATSRFIAISTTAPDGGQFLFSLTPRVMHWDRHTYLLDMGPVYPYWSSLAKSQELSVVEYVSSILTELTGGDLRAVLAPHPWQAILLLSATTRRPSLNFVDAQSYLGRRCLQDVTWNDWLTCCHNLRDHMQNRTSKKSSKDGNGSLSTLSKTINRLQFTHITQMSDIAPESMQRRFGKLAAIAWRWTWLSKSEDAPQQRTLFDAPFEDDFPWSNIGITETPSISRHLETPLREWDHITPLLCEDLDKLCSLACWSSSERVVSLEWELSFSCSPSLRIPVLFRHPHPLHRESGHHKTALLQAFHSWQKALAAKNKSETKGELYITGESITEWSITIKERLIFNSTFQSIFSDDLAKDSAKLHELENSLAVPLTEFIPTDHWAPEYSYERKIISLTEDSAKITSTENLGWIATNQRRPLFIYNDPHPPSDRHHSSGLIFTERVSKAWWTDRANQSTNSCRDYYVRITDDGLLQWVFQNDDGSLRVHGVYG
jgi:hypothetical protein